MRPLVLGLFLLAALPAPAQEQKREYIFGGELITSRERAQYRSEIAGAKDAKEQGELRERHRELMRKRARNRGVDLDDNGVVRRK